MLGDIFGYSREKAFGIASVVDSQGQAILMTGAKDECLLKQEQIHAYGPDPLMELSVGEHVRHRRDGGLGVGRPGIACVLY